VDELEEARLRSRGAQALDHAVRDAAAAVDGDAGRLVQRDEVVVLVEDRELLARPRGPGRTRGRRRRLPGPDRRQPDAVALGQPGIRACALAVHANLAGPDDPVEVALGHALERLGEEIVEALARGRLVDDDLADGVVA
jgi:hypothetical protein